MMFVEIMKREKENEEESKLGSYNPRHSLFTACVALAALVEEGKSHGIHAYSATRRWFTIHIEEC
jgi:hypothetical protein